MAEILLDKALTGITGKEHIRENIKDQGVLTWKMLL